MKANLEELVASKIRILRGRDAKTNLMVLEKLALEGSQTTYNINKLLGRSRALYSTTFRAVARLKKRGYIARTGTVKASKTLKRTPTYGLTWRGFIASLKSDKVCDNVLTVLEKNPQLSLPFPKDVILSLCRGLLSDEEIKEITRSLFQGFLKSIPVGIESVEEEKYLAYLLPAIVEAPPTTVKEIPQNRWEAVLRKHPKVLDWFEEEIEKCIKKFEENVRAFQEVRKFIQAIKARGENDESGKG